MATNKKRRKNTTAVAAAVSSATASSQAETSAEFAEEYSYVRKDLRHLAVISVVLFVLMLGIGFFI